MMLVGGSFTFGVVLGWAVAFAGGTWASIGYRSGAALVAVLTMWGLGLDAVLVALAGFVAASAGHDLFIWALSRRQV